MKGIGLAAGGCTTRSSATCCPFLLARDRSQSWRAATNDAPVAMLLAVLAAKLVAEKHAARFRQPPSAPQAAWSAPQAVWRLPAMVAPSGSSARAHRRWAKFLGLGASCESRVRARGRTRGPFATSQTPPRVCASLQARPPSAAVHRVDRIKIVFAAASLAPLTPTPPERGSEDGRAEALRRGA